MTVPFLRFATLLTLCLLPTVAAAQDDPYDKAINRIDSLYLWRDDVEPATLLLAAARELEEDVAWLMVDEGPEGIIIRHGETGELGRVQAASWADLAQALRQVEQLVTGAGDPLDLDAEVSTVLLRGATDGLDRHSRLLYGDRLKSFDKRLKGTLYGLGCKITSRDHRIEIKEIYPGTPAERGGLKVGDRVLRIDDVSTLGMSLRTAVDRITGPRDTPVTLRLVRDFDGEPKEFSQVFIRDEIRIPNITWRTLASGHAYLRIDHFSEKTLENMRIALAELDAEGSLDVGLVIDLRQNTGGSMIQSARSADEFVDHGVLVRTVGRGGDSVKGLVPVIQALDYGREPSMPLVVLQDDHTASGAEILAGSLRQLDRGILIGERSYGKGTVQKVYRITSNARLKLTVAEYLLSDDLAIAGVGLPPDVPVGTVRFSERGVSIDDPNAGMEPLWIVIRTDDWAPEAPPAPKREDPLLALAVDILETTAGATREDLLAAAMAVVIEARVGEEQRLREAYSLRGIDWTDAPVTLERFPEADVALALLDTAQAGVQVGLQATVTNNGSKTLYRVHVSLDSSDRVWNGRLLPIGRVDPGQTVTSVIQVEVPLSARSREADVSLTLQSASHLAASYDPTVLRIQGQGRPPLTVRVTLEADGAERRARVRVVQDSHETLEGLRVRFEHPESSGVELTHFDATLPPLAPGVAAEATLGLFLTGSEAEIPLQLIIEGDDWGELADWPLLLPSDGRAVTLSPPIVEAPQMPLSTPAGTLSVGLNASDDGRVDHVVVWAGRRKIAYASGIDGSLVLQVPLPIDPGRNRISVQATDDEGLTSWTRWTIRGIEEPPVTTDADEGSKD
jgi:carboxyl-terminal processing protease